MTLARAFKAGLGAIALAALLGPAAARVEAAPRLGPAAARSVTLKVLMPSYGGWLKVNGREMKKLGFERVFTIPGDIEIPAGTAELLIEAEIRPNNYEVITRVRRVPIEPGRDIVADLREKDERFPDKIFIRFIPTPPEIVQEMLKLAGVGPQDTVYDLGCGDGRIVIEAVKTFGARRGVGIDLDPKRVEESRKNALDAGVQAKTEFRVGDVLDIKDLAEASVVVLFISQDLNLALRPVLQHTLKPGARVVSSYFTMGGWKPAHTVFARTENDVEYPLHLWIIK
jgi:precorrin-6B methylase 2